tara:strand:+ start:127 stop:1572 length:1446 start_codon:yes stop_codon:yes gene_type:complete
VIGAYGDEPRAPRQSPRRRPPGCQTAKATTNVSDIDTEPWEGRGEGGGGDGGGGGGGGWHDPHFTLAFDGRWGDFADLQEDGETSLTWQRGLEMFRRGACFGVTRNHEITTNDTINESLRGLLEMYTVHGYTKKLQNTTFGKNNSFGGLPPDDSRNVTNLTGHPGSDVGRRIETQDSSEDAELDNLQWNEVWLTLYASLMDVGPLVYAIGRCGTGNRLAMLVQKGTHSLHEELGNLLNKLKSTRQWFWEAYDTHLLSKDTLARAKAVSRSLAGLVKKTGEIGLLLIDIKAGNVVVFDGDDDWPSVKMIDFDYDYTRLVPRPTPGAESMGSTALPKCVEFVNGLWLLSFLACRHRDTAHLVVEDLIARLRYIGETKFSEDGRGLCDVLRTLNAKGVQIGGDLLDVDDPSLGLPKLLVDMMSHYMGWKKGQTITCGVFSSAKGDASFVWEHLWEIAVRIATVTGKGGPWGVAVSPPSLQMEAL